MQIRRYGNWGGILKCLVVLSFVDPTTAAADGNGSCPSAEAKGANGIIEFSQYRFPDGSSDLVLMPQNGSDMEVRRVTFEGSKTEGCLYRSLAIAPGGSDDQWGWHLAWAGEEGVRYARMDGQAWVSSPPKRLSAASASEVRLEINGSELLLRWHERHGGRTEAYQAVSHDEGRSWAAPQQIHPDN